MAEIYFNKSHEYVRVEGDVAVVGITDYAQQQLGDIVFVELPDNGKTLSSQDEAAVVESVKAASEVYTPVSGEISEANEALVANPALVNEDPEGEGWFFKLKLSDNDDLNALMDKDAYEAFIKELD